VEKRKGCLEKRCRREKEKKLKKIEGPGKWIEGRGKCLLNSFEEKKSSLSCNKMLIPHTTHRLTYEKFRYVPYSITV
jgi:hypothetical protein